MRYLLLHWTNLLFSVLVMSNIMMAECSDEEDSPAPPDVSAYVAAGPAAGGGGGHIMMAECSDEEDSPGPPDVSANVAAAPAAGGGGGPMRTRRARSPLVARWCPCPATQMNRQRLEEAHTRLRLAKQEEGAAYAAVVSY